MLKFIVTQTPLRLSFAGGGTDLEEFFSKEDGQVVSTSINQFVYVTAKRHNNRLNPETYRLNYFASEHVDNIEDIKNNIIRETLKLLKFEDPIYVSTVADVPANSGLGSSSAFAVGLLHAVHLLKGEQVSLPQLAEEACQVEIELLGSPIGKQDQYATAIGGMNRIFFSRDGSVMLEPVRLASDAIRGIFSHFMMFSTRINRSANDILSQQASETRAGTNFSQLRLIKDHCARAAKILRTDFDPVEFGAILDETWRVKRTLSDGVSSSDIDRWYDAAMKAGALGGKICGAGGGGYLLLLVPGDKQPAVRSALQELVEANFSYEPLGSRVVVAK